MQGLVEKWNNYKTSKRLKSLWNEYKALAKLNDEKSLHKLDDFLSMLKEQLAKFLKESPNIKDIISECEDVLKCIVEYFAKYEDIIQKSENITLLSDILDKALDVVEFIIRDPKYKKQIESSPQVISDLLNLIAKVERSESKVTIIKILVVLADNVQSKVEFGRQNGFKKLLELIINNNNELGRIVSKALLHFLNIPQLQTKLLSTFGITHEIPDEQLNSIKSKLKKLADDFRTITASELQRIFYTNSRQGSLGEGALNAEPAETRPAGSGLLKGTNELVNQDEIFEYSMSLTNTPVPPPTATTATNKSASTNISTNTTGGDTKKKGGDKDNLTRDEEDIIKEFAVVQGGLKSICQSLLEAAEEIQLDFMNTITKLLLSDNPKYKEEFKSINGYTILENFFNYSRDFTDRNTLFFLQSCFEFAILIIYEGDPSNVVQNIDCFTFLLRIIANSPHQEVILMGMNYLSGIFAANWRNVVIAQKQFFTSYVFHLLSRLTKTKNKMFCIESPKDMIDISPIMCLKTVDNESFDEEEVKEAARDKAFFTMKKGLINLDFIEIDPSQTEQLLVVTTRLMMHYSNVLGVYDAHVPIIFCELSLSSNEMVAMNQFFLDSLLELFLTKLPRLCGSFLFMEDFYHDMLFSKLTLLFQSVYYQYEKGGDADNLLKCMHVLDRILTCKHKNDSSIISKISPDSRPHNKNFSCRNICIELQKCIIENVRSEVQTQERMVGYLELINSKGDRKAEFMAMMRFLKNVLLNADDLMKMFLEADGIERLYTLVLNTYDKLKRDPFFLNDIADIIIELSVGTICNPGKLRGQGLTLLNQLDLIPLLDAKRSCFLPVLFKLALSCQLTEENAAIFELLNLLLQRPENLKLFKEKGGFQFLMRLLIDFSSTNRHYLHSQLISCFELFIPKMQNDELELYLDVIINREFLKRGEGSSEIFIDTLALLTVHFAVNNNHPLVEKFCVGDYILNLLACFDVADYYVKEALLKFIGLMLSLGKNVKSKTALVTQKPKVMLILQRVLLNGQPNEQLLNILYELCYHNFDLKTNISFMFPSHSTTVSAIINRSSLADIVLNTNKGGDTKGGHGAHVHTKDKILNNIEFLEVFLAVLKKCTDENIKNDYLKKLEAHMDASNMDKLIDSNFLSWIASFAREDIIKKEQPRYLPTLFNLLFKMFYHDFKKPPKHFKFLELLKRLTEDDYLIMEIVKMVFTKLRENPIIPEGDSNLLKNIATVFLNVDELTGVSWELNFMMLQLINTFASKNAGNVRTQMKNLELFDIRDKFLIEILRFTTDNPSMLSIVKELSFGAVANQSKFRDSHTLSFLLKLLIDRQNTTPEIQNYIIRVLRDEISTSEENQKYVAKLLDNQKIVLALFPSYNERKSSFAKCLSSITKSSAQLNESDQNNEDEDEDEDNDGDEEVKGDMKTTDQQHSTPHKGSGSGASVGIKDLAEYINSTSLDDERKVILARIKKNIANIMADYAKQESKIQNKIGERKKKVFEVTGKERQASEKFITDIDGRIKACQEKSSEKFKLFATLPHF